ncbi:MAG: hypothetical protein FJ363_11405 [Gemmatimonadetes bacterium]|nr:hypothetical protein [Gemmatimonadota bacterium]
MLFRHHTPAEQIAERFRADDGLFSADVEDGLHVVRVAAGMERSVDLLHALAEHLPPVVDCSIECIRSARRFVGEGLSLPEVREAIGRLKVPLVASGGVELAVFTPDDQLVLNPMLDLWLYSRTDRWVYLLVGEGLEQVEQIPARSWRVARDEFTGAPELVSAIEKTAERLTLRLL